jgi:hypothetical protein
MARRIWSVFVWSFSNRSLYQYVANQEEHHKKRTFKEEYIDFLEKFEIEYNEKYLFDWID